MKLCALIWLAAVMASAQSYEIRGVLLEKATERPITGSVQIARFTSNDQRHDVATNASGEFQVQVDAPGTYGVRYDGSGEHRPLVVMVELASTERRKSVRLLAERVGRVTGRVLDDATGEPLKDVPATILQIHWVEGEIEADEQPLKTDAEGRVYGSGERSWPWIIAIRPRLVAPANSGENSTTKFSDADVAVTDEDYEESYWPGATPFLRSALPAPYIADQTTDIGNIRVRKVKYRRALLRFPLQEGCFENQPFRARFAHPRDELRDFTVYCGRDQLLRGLVPGMQYRFEITPAESVSPEAWRTGVLEFVVGDKNPELRVSLTRGVDLEGRLVLAPGSSAPTKPLILGINQGVIGQERRLDREGRFQFVNVPLGQHGFLVNSEERHYAQQVRINGVDVLGLGHYFEWTGQGTIEVVIDDQPASVTGVVTDGSQTTAPAKVVIAPWPVPKGRTVFDVRYSAEVDGAGRYRLEGLPPGEYRGVAVRGESRDRLEEPGVLERLLAGAEKVTLGRGSAATLDVRVVELK